MPDLDDRAYIIAERLKHVNATLVGKAYDTSQFEDRLAFGDWLVDVCDRLGLDLRVHYGGQDE